MKSSLRLLHASPARGRGKAIVKGEPNAREIERRPAGRSAALAAPRNEEALLQRWEPLARYLAHRFVGALEREDLEQVARLALVQAARRFDPARGCQFSTFAAVTILGELQRFLRDRGPAMRVPRRWWELRPRLEKARERLAQLVAREPTVTELAAQLAVSEADVAGALGVYELYHLQPLDHPHTTPEGGEPESLAGTLGFTDPRLEAVEQQVGFQQMMQRLPDRLREVLQQRYFQGRSQREVAFELGVSQMQISRLERRALAQLREELHGPTHGCPCGRGEEDGEIGDGSGATGA
jgi:RNA polymerase sigma-B factor